MPRLSDWTFDDRSPLERFRRWRLRMARRPLAEVYSEALWGVLFILVKITIGVACAAVLAAISFGAWLVITG